MLSSSTKVSYNNNNNNNNKNNNNNNISIWQESMSRCMQLHNISIAAFSLTDLSLDPISLEWDSHDQLQETNWRHCVTRPELPFFHRRKDILKIDQSVKRPERRLSMGVACSYSSAPPSDDIRELKHATFLSHGRQPEVNNSHARTVVFPRFSN